jgi:hypothetical protein
MTDNEELKELDRQLWDLTRKLTAAMVPYNPPKPTKTMEENNPYGYNLLMKYIELEEKFNELKEKITEND